ncbi:hypothetical protein ABEF95_010998 [Exophiala dermatitidis]
MASAPKSKFPEYLDGDVLLILSSTQQFKLHSQVLSTHSTFFAQEIAAKPAARLTAQARRDHAAAYRFEYAPTSQPDGIGKWVRKDLNSEGRIPRNSMPLMPDFANGTASNDNPTHKAWEWLFGIFYNREPAFVNNGLVAIVSEIIVLMEVADSVGSTDHVRDVVDLTLLRQDRLLWNSIMNNSVAWLELGRRVRSPTVFSEAAIHLIGQWCTLPENVKEQVSSDLRPLIERKADLLDLEKEAIEMRILGHYPQFLLRTAAEKPGRPSYANDIYMWMSVSFFRQWFAQNVSDDRTRRAPDGGLNFYTALSEGGQAYLSHTDFQEFHRFFPMSIKACHVVEANMGVFKEDIKPLVEGLMVENTHLKRADCRTITWLTCATVERDELPWQTVSADAGNEGRTGDQSLQNLYAELDKENDNAAMLAQHDRNKKLRKRSKPAAAVAPAPAISKPTSSTSTSGPARRRKRLRVIEDDETEDEFGDGSGLFVPESTKHHNGDRMDEAE